MNGNNIKIILIIQVNMIIKLLKIKLINYKSKIMN